MVGPSIGDGDRRSLYRRLAVGFVAVVAVSGGLTALHAGGSPGSVAVATLGGGLVGILLAAYLARLAGEASRGDRRRRG